MIYRIKIILFIAVLSLPSDAVISTQPASAGYYRFPLKGFHLACSDGKTTDAAVFPGVGMMLLRNNGSLMNEFPLVGMEWSPVFGGSSLCWSRPMSAQTQRDLTESFYRYCVQRRSAYCRYE
jgi:hypothetical protein